LIKLAKKYECPRCHTPIDIDKIVGVGVKESYKIKGKDVIFFEYLCKNCDDMYVFELDFADMGNFLPKLLGEMKSGENEDVDDIDNLNVNNLVRIKSKISNKEIKDVKKFLSSCRDFEDFMAEIGITKEQINEYGQYNKEKDK